MTCILVVVEVLLIDDMYTSGC